jgi:dihydrofolate reductase
LGKLIYLMNVSLDGFVAKPDGSLDWTTVDDELHSWFNEHMREVSASMYGRRLYEVMSAYWPTGDTGADAGVRPVLAGDAADRVLDDP